MRYCAFMLGATCSALVACTDTSQLHGNLGSDTYSDSCIRDPEIVVSGDPGVEQKTVDVQICYAKGREKIVVRVGSKEVEYGSEEHVGARVRFEYRFRHAHDVLLVSYGYDSESLDYDYLLFEIGVNGVAKTGTSTKKPSLEDIL